ncbi:hypothetical protein EVAR_98200_1 [Eumeta japonica]|uniref:Uncharacterized protein n=1 Tax=Eumeta variegata TaxID=151549 RepID=A0A4C1Y542_EUMVA|nr:hypothetical protein EVAR_98200_1 [Eumeta japonica]
MDSESSKPPRRRRILEPQADMVVKTSEMTGVSQQNIYSVLSEYKETHAVTAKETTKSKLSTWDRLDDFEKSDIRRKIIQLDTNAYKRNAALRLIVVHIGNEAGFIEECQWAFECSKTGDYHESMDAPHFEDWFAKVLIKV